MGLIGETLDGSDCLERVGDGVEGVLQEPRSFKLAEKIEERAPVGPFICVFGGGDGG